MIDLKEEVMLDFSISSSRVLITEKLVLVDNIIRIVDFTDRILVVQTGRNSHTVIKGENIIISGCRDSRIICSGDILSVEFDGKAGKNR